MHGWEPNDVLDDVYFHIAHMTRCWNPYNLQSQILLYHKYINYAKKIQFGN
jgi:hypothetical protein